MFIYEGIAMKREDGRYSVAIQKISHDEYGCDVIKESIVNDEQEAQIWIDDEISRLTTGKGVWE